MRYAKNENAAAAGTFDIIDTTAPASPITLRMLAFATGSDNADLIVNALNLQDDVQQNRVVVVGRDPK